MVRLVEICVLKGELSPHMSTHVAPSPVHGEQKQNHSQKTKQKPAAED